MTGGKQAELLRRIGKNTKTYETLINKYEQGSCVIAGTSAGAMVMPKILPNGGTSSDIGKVLDSVLDAGLGLIHNIIVDTHFSERHRFERLSAIIAKYPGNIGLGIDEKASLILQKDLGTVFAEEGKYVYVIVPIGHHHQFPEDKRFVVNEDVVYRFAHGDVIDIKHLRMASREEVMMQQRLAKPKSPAPVLQR